MPGAIIAFDQARPSTPSYGSPGIARDDLWESWTVTCRCTTTGNTSYAWEFLSIPAGSAAVLATPDASSATFDPDLPGSYRVQLTTNGGGPGNVQILIAAIRYDDTGTLVNRGWRVPAVGELPAEDNMDSNVRGWSAALEFILADILANAFGGGGGGGNVEVNGVAVPNNPHSTTNFIGSNVTGSDDGSGTATVYTGGISDNASEERTRLNASNLRRDESYSGLNPISFSDIPSLTGGGGAIASIGSLVFFGDISGNLYCMDVITGLSGAGPSTSLYTCSGVVSDMIGVRGVSDYLIAVDGPGSHTAYVLSISAASTPPAAASLIASTVLPAAPARVCLVKGGGPLLSAPGSYTPAYAVSCSDGSINIIQNGSIAASLATGDVPTAMEVDDSGYLWVLYTTAKQLVQLSVNPSTYAMAVVQTISLPSGAPMDLCIDGRNVWVLYKPSSSMALVSYDLRSGARTSTFTSLMAFSGGGPISARCVWDGQTIFCSLPGNESVSHPTLVRIHPQTGEVLFQENPVQSASMVIDDSGTCWLPVVTAGSMTGVYGSRGSFPDIVANTLRVNRPVIVFRGNHAGTPYAAAALASATVAYIDDSGGAVLLNTPTAPYDGQPLEVHSTSGATSLQTNNGGVSIEDPNAMGTFQSGSTPVSMTVAGNETWRWDAVTSKWRIS